MFLQTFQKTECITSTKQYGNKDDIYHYITNCLNTLLQPPGNKLMHYTTFSLWCRLAQCYFNLGSALAERVGQREVGECNQKVQIAWLLLGLAVESTCSALGGPFLSSVAWMG